MMQRKGEVWINTVSSEEFGPSSKYFLSSVDRYSYLMAVISSDKNGSRQVNDGRLYCNINSPFSAVGMSILSGLDPLLIPPSKQFVASKVPERSVATCLTYASLR